MASKTKTKKRFKIRQIFNEKGNGFDLPFLGIVIILLRFGLVMLYSASYVKAIYKFDDSLHYIRKQVLYAILGFGVMIFASRVDYQIYRRFILQRLSQVDYNSRCGYFSAFGNRKVCGNTCIFSSD